MHIRNCFNISKHMNKIKIIQNVFFGRVPYIFSQRLCRHTIFSLHSISCTCTYSKIEPKCISKPLTLNHQENDVNNIVLPSWDNIYSFAPSTLKSFEDIATDIVIKHTSLLKVLCRSQNVSIYYIYFSNL